MRGGARRDGMGAAAVVVALALAAGCGDDRLAAPVATGVSGKRLAVVWLGYDDGARQLVLDQLYDRVEHTPCAPTTWSDGVVRCVPIAGDAVYTDADCTTLRGLAAITTDPSHFVAHDRVGGARLVTRVFRAGVVTSGVSSYYERRDGACVGPLPADGSLVAYLLGEEVAGASLMPIYRTEVVGEHLALTVEVSDDGLWRPVRLRDRALDLSCWPAVEPDGAVRCRPSAARTDWFVDPSCTQPVVLVGPTEPVPAVIGVDDAAGCPTFHRVGEPVTGPFYRRDGDLCRVAPVDARTRALAAGPALALTEVTRTIEAEPRRRLQRVVLADGELRFADLRLHDTATGADCLPEELGGTIRCLPAVLAQASTLYSSPTCAVARPVVRLPQPVCGQPRFARTAPESPAIGLHAIGDPVSDPLYLASPGLCSPFAPLAGSLFHDAGPVIDSTLFVGGVLFGER